MPNNDKCALHIPHKLEVEDSHFMQENWLALERWARDSAKTECDPGGAVCPSYATYELTGGTAMPSGIYTTLGWNKISGSNVLNLTNPLAPSITNAGLYQYTVQVNIDAGAAGKVLGAYFNTVQGQIGFCPLDNIGLIGVGGVHLSAAYHQYVSDVMDVSAAHDLAAAANVSGTVLVAFLSSTCVP